MTENSFQPTRAIEVIYCHSDDDKDKYLRDQLEKHLMAMQREGVITTWHEDKIGAGEEWQSQIDKHIDTARIILPLISSDFVDSDKSYELELSRAVKRHKSLETYVIPIILRPVDWHYIRFDDITLGDMSVLPKNSLPVTSWRNHDEAFLNIAENIRQLTHDIWQRDELGINDAYHQLKQELAAAEWQKANETTKYLVFKISNQEQTGFISQEAIRKIPSRDIRVINNLWVQYSYGHFGFSIQRKLLEQNNYQDFLNHIGWNIDKSWLEEEDLNFTLNAPQGHLPYCGIHFWKAEPSPSPNSPIIPYYRIPAYNNYKIPPNYYRWQRDQQYKFKEQFSVDSKFTQLLNSPSYLSSFPNQVSINNKSDSGIGQALAGLAVLASRALPWAIGITVVGVGIYAAATIYNNYQEEQEQEKRENEIKEKINGFFYHLDSWTI